MNTIRKSLSNNTVNQTPSNSNSINSINNTKNTNQKNITKTNNLKTNNLKTNNLKTNNLKTNNLKTNNLKTNTKNLVNKVDKLSGKFILKLCFYLMCVFTVVNILLLIYLNRLYRKNYVSGNAIIISGNCDDKENLLGIDKSKCKIKVKYSPSNSNNADEMIETEIVIKDKNKIRDENNEKIIKIDIHKDEPNKIKVQRDIARGNLYLSLSLILFIIMGGLCFWGSRR
jgi:hypothetical protein